LELTKFKLPIRVGQRTKKVKAAYEADDVNAKWGKTSWARKLEKKRLVFSSHLPINLQTFIFLWFSVPRSPTLNASR
jgi:hypothetical protein